MFRKLWDDDTGALLSAELLMLLTIMVIGTAATMKSVASALSAEADNVVQSFRILNQTDITSSKVSNQPLTVITAGTYDSQSQ